MLASGLPDAATSEDVLRLFEGFDLHAKSVTFVRERKVGAQRGAGGGGVWVRVCVCGGLPGPRISHHPRAPLTPHTHTRAQASSEGREGRAIVRFATQEEARRALRSRQGTFCISAPVHLRVLL